MPLRRRVVVPRHARGPVGPRRRVLQQPVVFPDVCFQGGAALTIAPVPARSAAPRSATIVGQVIDAPVNIPDKVPAFLSSTPDQQKKNDKAKKYKLLLFNDNVNKREYVAKVLTTTIPDFSQADAYVVMQKAHQSGMAVVGVWVFELAEAYCDGLKARALICSVTEEDD